jgi:hypothetical protein
MDAVHMIKLQRNLIGDKKEVWIPGFDQAVKWDHYLALYEQQSELGLRAGNKLSKIHLFYQKNKMKVYPAVQLLSTSVADSLQVELDSKENPRLSDCEATIYMTRAMDCLFDFCNSRSAKAYGQKEPITLENFDSKKKQMLEIVEMLKGMKIREWRVNRTTKKKECREVLVKDSNKKLLLLVSLQLSILYLTLPGTL